MAKISARGATEVARVKYVRRDAVSGSAWTGILVLCSDGRILDRLTGDLSGGYSVATRIPKAEATKGLPLLQGYAVHCGLEVL